MQVPTTTTKSKDSDADTFDKPWVAHPGNFVPLGEKCSSYDGNQALVVVGRQRRRHLEAAPSNLHYCVSPTSTCFIVDTTAKPWP